MTSVAVAVRIVLAGIFVASGLGKAFDAGRTKEAAAGFGAPARLAGAIAVGLPALELALAGGLLLDRTARAAAIAASALLVVLSLSIGFALVRGRRSSCRCFGVLSGSGLVGPRTLARNLVLLAAALALAVAP